MNQTDEKEVLHRLTIVEERAKSNTHRLDDITQDIDTIRKIEVKQEEDRRDIQKLKEDSNMMFKLITSQEVMNHNIENMNKEFAKQNEHNNKRMDTFTDTFEKMNSNLTALNTTQQQMSNEIQNMQKDISSTKEHVKEVESMAQKNKENMSFNVVKFLSNDGTKIIFTAILVAILSFIGLK